MFPAEEHLRDVELAAFGPQAVSVAAKRDASLTEVALDALGRRALHHLAMARILPFGVRIGVAILANRLADDGFGRLELRSRREHQYKERGAHDKKVPLGSSLVNCGKLRIGP